MPGELPTMQAGPEAAGERQESALRHMAGAAVHFASEAVKVVLTPHSHAAEDAVANARAARREGDRVNPMKVDVSPWVNTDHRT